MGEFNFGYKPNSPCKRDCKERNARCHATCQKYLEWTKKWAKERAAIREKIKMESAFNDYDNHSRIQKSRGGY